MSRKAPLDLFKGKGDATRPSAPTVAPLRSYRALCPHCYRASFNRIGLLAPDLPRAPRGRCPNGAEGDESAPQAFPRPNCMTPFVEERDEHLLNWRAVPDPAVRATLETLFQRSRR